MLAVFDSSNPNNYETAGYLIVHGVILILHKGGLLKTKITIILTIVIEVLYIIINAGLLVV